MMEAMQPDDPDYENIQRVIEKLDYINQRDYGDSVVLSLYHQIRDRPVSKKRSSLFFFSHRPKTIYFFKLNHIFSL
jgi:hypothetical protein